MAENEILDFGHATRWRKSRMCLKDPNSTLLEFVNCASEELEATIRRLPAVLRKTQGQLDVIRAAKGDPIALQAAVAALTQKRLGKAVAAADQLVPSGDPASVSRHASLSIFEGMIDQIVSRSKREARFCSVDEQESLRATLQARFASCVDQLAATIESSLRGQPIKPVRLPRRPITRMQPRDVAHMSLTIPRPEQPHAAR